MNVGGLRLGPSSDAERDRIVASVRGASLTYDHVGSTLDPARWSGSGVRARHLDVGSGSGSFLAGREALSTWVAQAGIGASVHPPGQPVEAGATLGWQRWVTEAGFSIGMHVFGASGPAPALFEHFGFTAENVASEARRVRERLSETTAD